MRSCDLAVAAMAALLIFCPIPFFDFAAGTSSSPVMDGVIAEGEYEHAADLSGGEFLLRWQVHGETVYFAMSAITDGYLAIGFGPEFLMKNADLVVGWVDGEGNASVVDAHSPGNFGPVTRDIDLGGSDDILEHAGAVNDGWTVIEFRRALSTGDRYDNDIPLDEELVVMWAIGGVFDPATMPDDGGMGTISISSGASSESSPTFPILIAFLLMAMTSAMASLLVLRGPASLRRTGHVVLGAVTTGLLACAALIAVMTGTAETPTELAYSLLTATALVFISVLIGAAARGRDARPRLNKVHVLSAAAAIVGMAGCLLMVLLL